MRALDLFCCAGGASDGLAAAGYEVTGVDIAPQKNYPFRFIQGDVLSLNIDLSEYDLIWASPPCQRYSVATRSRPDYCLENYPDLIGAVREMLSGHPVTVIENVPRAPLRADLVLTGPMVGLSRIERRRHFELSFRAYQPPIKRLPRMVWDSGRGVTVTKSLSSSNHFYTRKALGLPGRVPVAEACEAMGITRPMTAAEVGESIPPAYAFFIAVQAIPFLRDQTNEFRS